MDNNKLTSLIKVNKDSNPLLKEIATSINGYLINNKGNAADFHLLKNIVDRHIDSVDEEIGHLLPVPLYLGLAGTMIGIITGLMCIDGDVAGVGFVNSISLVISNIKWAMICSLVGLSFTTYLSAWAYRRSKASMERQKNQLLDYLQSELLPHLNEDATATLLNMQANLQLFNQKFETNISGFSTIMKDVHDAFDSQVQLVQQLKHMDLVQMSTLNMTVLEKLHSSMGEFEKFTRYLNQMNMFVQNTTRLTDSINNQLQRTNLVQDVAVGIKDNIERNETVMRMLHEFLGRVDESAAILQASKSLDSEVEAAMQEMRKHVNTEVENLKNYTKTATEDLESLMTKERGHLSKLDNLDSLRTLARSVDQMVQDTTTINKNLATRISELNQQLKAGIGTGGSSSGLPSWLSYIVAIVVIVTCVSLMYKVFFIN